MVHYSIFAVGACVSSSQPFLDALGVKPMKTREDHELLLKFIETHADGAGLVLLREVKPVAFCEVGYRQELDYSLWDRDNDVVVKVKQGFIIIKVAKGVETVGDLVHNGGSFLIAYEIV